MIYYTLRIIYIAPVYVTVCYKTIAELRVINIASTEMCAKGWDIRKIRVEIYKCD